jgi:hypothetical protein
MIQNALCNTEIEIYFSLIDFNRWIPKNERFFSEVVVTRSVLLFCVMTLRNKIV